MMRSTFIVVLVTGYAWFHKQSAVSFAISFLIAAGLQLVVVILRRLVPTDRLPQAIYIFELVADGLSVLLFALGVFGSLLTTATEA